MKKQPIYKFSENVPGTLIDAYVYTGRSCRKLAQELGVNHFYVDRFLRDGIEPTNPEIRVKLFLSKTPRKSRIPKSEEWRGQKQVKRNIAKMAKNLRNSFKEFTQ